MDSNCSKYKDPNTVYFMQGETFTAVFVYRVDHEPTLLENGYDLIVGLWDMQGKLLKKGSVKDDTIVVFRDNTYRMPVYHEESMRMLGKIRMEVTVANERNEVVNHADEYLNMIFAPVNNNKIL